MEEINSITLGGEEVQKLKDWLAMTEEGSIDITMERIRFPAFEHNKNGYKNKYKLRIWIYDFAKAAGVSVTQDELTEIEHPDEITKMISDTITEREFEQYQKLKDKFESHAAHADAGE